MTRQPDLYEFVEPVTREELDSALLEMTGDLDKSKVLHSTLPLWLIEAPSSTLAALERAHQSAEAPCRRLQARLARLQPLDGFCVEKLEAYLISRGHSDLDLRRDYLEIPWRERVGVTPLLTGTLIEHVVFERHCLLRAAMQNFSAGEAERNGLPASSVIRRGAQHTVVDDLSAHAFVGYCRELDLGSAYQAHVREVFSLPMPGEEPMGLSFNQAATDVGECKTIDMQIDLHVALAKGHISATAHARLLPLIKSDLAAADELSEEPLLNWQGLNIDGACLWSVLVFSDAAAGQLPSGACIVYMPNEPERPWFEYHSLEDFRQYLTMKLQRGAYRRSFERYLDESERLGFFARADERKGLGALQTLAVKTNFSGFFFHAYVGKIQLDAQVLAVPVAQMDEEERQQRLLTYLDAGLDVLNVAAFVVPGLGELMMGVAIGQLLGEVFDGVEDWSHHDNASALNHLINVAENIAGMMLFAAGGRVVGTLKRKFLSSSAFFDKVEAVRLQDHRPRLWLPHLRHYSQSRELQVQWKPNSRGVHQTHGGSYIQLHGDVYSIVYDPGIGQWRINHPQRPTAYRPPLEHNFQGGWQHVFERPSEWNNPLYTLERLDPEMTGLPQEALQGLAAINDLSLEDLQFMSQEHRPLPERFHDSVARFRQHQKVLDLIYALEQEQALDPTSGRTQMLALPLMEGWPRGRFFEVLDSEEGLLESHPDMAPFDYEDLSIHLSEQQLNQGEVLSTLLAALSTSERTALLGQAVDAEQALPVLKRRLLDTLKAHHRSLYLKLYDAYNGVATGDLVPLCAHFPGLPRRVAWELLSRATTAQRRYLRSTGRVPLALGQRSREALDHLAQDQALMGLYWPQLAGAETRRVALGLLQRLHGWPDDVLLQVREGGVNGAVKEQAGSATAPVRRSIVQTDQGFQAFDTQGQSLNTPASGAEGFYQAVVDCLSPQQRKNMNLMGDRAAERLRMQLLFKSEDERQRVARYLWPERFKLEEQASSCVAALRPADVQATTFAPALVRKVKKLYPLLTPTQVSQLLQDAGPDHLSRARAVEAWEQEFNALHQALKRWSSDKSAYVPSRDPLWDYRLSRYQAMKRIESCWRGMSLVKDANNLDVPGLTLDGMAVGKLPTLPAQVRFERVHSLSLRNMGLSDDVAYFLKHFKAARRVDLSHNQLLRMPEVLVQMPDLEHLYLGSNRLQMNEYMRQKLAGLRQLKTLDLAQNPLVDAPDVNGLFDLKALILRDCQLKAFPAGMQRLPYLEQADLRENELVELPPWLLKMPRRYAHAVNLRHNPLSANSRLLLHNFRTSVGVGMGFLEDDIGRLTEQKARENWLPDDRVARYAEKDLTWTGLKNEPGCDGLFNLLAELSNTADAQHVRADLERRVWRLLDATAADATLREEVFERAATPLNCDDAAAVNFSSLEILVDIHEASQEINGRPLSARPLLKLAKGLFRLDCLELIARRHSEDHPLADPLEVSLAYRTGLVDSVYLPGQPRRMRFALLAGVTQGQLDLAESELKLAELSPAMLKYITQLPFWRSYLRKTFASRFEAVNAPFDRRMEGVFEQSLTLGDEDYRDQMNEILREQVLAEDTEIDSLTQNALRLDDLHLCERPVS